MTQTSRVFVVCGCDVFGLWPDDRIRRSADHCRFRSDVPTPLANYIRPFVGTKGEGDTYPGPTAPFGMVQLSPDTDRTLCSGYAYTDPTIMGFSLTHLSGTGCSDLGDFLFMPQIGPPQLNAGIRSSRRPATSRCSRTPTSRPRPATIR